MNKKPVYILGIESSCDDTAAAVSMDDKILSNIIANQQVHQSFGGVVPELASRAHQQNIIPVVSEALRNADISRQDLNAVAFTRGPGLIGSLLVGSSFAKSFALALDIPIIEVNHMEAHVLSNFAGSVNEINFVAPEFPFLCLTVSGGHTQIVLVSDYYTMKVIGETTDDAAGEAFDKAAKMLGLPYPGGPLIDKNAKNGNPSAFKFPKPESPELNFSFSGLKTAILYFLQKQAANDSSFIENNLADLCASIQFTIVEILMNKLKLASLQTGIKNIAVAGGVSANSFLRNAILKEQELNNWKVHIPPMEYCTDNAAMIATAGYYKFLKEDFASQEIAPVARYPVGS